MITTIILSLFLVLFIFLSIYSFIGLNKYVSKLEEKIAFNLTVTENLKQTIRDLLVEDSFLLDDGKIKKTLFENEKKVIYNGARIEEQGLEL